jgi:2,4-didehydro-3-deoxy-L-rhamnonate hydrolase
MITKFLNGMAISCLLTLLAIVPAQPAGAQSPGSGPMAGIILDSLAEAGILKKNRIKHPTEALTLSRIVKDGKVHILVVLQDDGEKITGVDLSEALGRFNDDIFSVIAGIEFDDIAAMIQGNARMKTVSYTNILPCVAGNKHLAIGINYTEHGRETGQVRPFMFPKLVETDPAVHTLKYKEGWLLDYEVELGITFPSNVCSPAFADNQRIGFMVVNDFTDRATLMRKMDSQDVTGGKGFPDAKSLDGFLPTGPYMVIPRNWRTFVEELQLELTVNGNLRQKGAAKDMVWNIEEIIRRSLGVKNRDSSYYEGRRVPLFEGDCIPAGSIIVTGTPAGVVFKAPKGGFIFGSVLKYIFTARFFSAKMHPYILQEYLKKQMDNPNYLKPGDRVESTISFLGTIKTSVVQ